MLSDKGDRTREMIVRAQEDWLLGRGWGSMGDSRPGDHTTDQQVHVVAEERCAQPDRPGDTERLASGGGCGDDGQDDEDDGTDEEQPHGVLLPAACSLNPA